MIKKALSTIITAIALTPTIIYAAPFLIGGSLSSVVLGGSMEPTIRVGGIVIVEKIKSEDVKVGDIIAFKIGKTKTIHRVIEKVAEKTRSILGLRAVRMKTQTHG
ncbi:MAG: signal peptidase I [Candidatus Bathyarchaeota archaeon]|nr:signal peptidase I [Candidatus Bathyarchaeota archaeon]